MKRILLLLLAFGLVSCGAPQAAQQTLRLAISPAAYPAASALMACLPTGEGVAVSIDSVYPSEVDLAVYDLYIQLGAHPAAGFAAEVASEQLVLALPASQTAALNSAQASLLLSGALTDWQAIGGQAGAPQLLIPPASDEARQQVETQRLQGVPFAPNALIVAPEAALRKLESDTAVVALLPAAWLPASLPSIALGIELPVLAQAPAEPQGLARNVLACLQSSAGQARLAESYP